MDRLLRRQGLPDNRQPAFRYHLNQAHRQLHRRERQKQAGKVVTRNRKVVSSDGKVMTMTAAGTDAQGQPFTNVLVFDRR